MSIIPIDLLSLATNPLYYNNLSATNVTSPQISLLSYSETFTSDVIYPNASARLLSDLSWQAFHEGGVYDASTNALYVSSNYESLSDSINMSIIYLTANNSVENITSSQFPNLWEANGDFTHYSGLVSVNPSTNESTVTVNNFLSRNFSSVNDARQHPVTGDIWFTDAAYGYFQNFRPTPSIPQQVYRFEPTTGNIQVVADGFVQPNGLEFSPDLSTLYITDTGAQEFTANSTRPATIYAYNISSDARSLSNRRVFAYAASGFPDGIHTDTAGNVWAGCGDGVHVWDSSGRLIGKVFIGETSNNFAFGPGGIMWVFSNYRLWEVTGLRVTGREVCKDWYGLKSCGIQGAKAPGGSG